MRKILFIFLAFIILTTSCSESEVSVPSFSEKDLLNTWSLTELYSKNSKITATTNTGITIDATTVLTSKNYINPTTTFTDNPKKVSHNGSLTLVSEITVLGQTYTQEQAINFNPTLKSDWSLSGKILTFSLQDQIIGKIDAEIISHTSNTLKLKALISKDYPLPPNFTLPTSIGAVSISSAKIEGVLYLTYTK